MHVDLKKQCLLKQFILTVQSVDKICLIQFESYETACMNMRQACVWTHSCPLYTTQIQLMRVAQKESDCNNIVRAPRTKRDVCFIWFMIQTMNEISKENVYRRISS